MFCGYLRQSTAATIMLGPIVDDDGITVATGLTISQADVRLSKNAGNMAQKNESTSCTHDELGVYTCPLDTTDTNTLGLLDVVVQESGNLVARQSYMVITAGEWDRLMSASGAIPNSGIVARGTAQSATATTLVLASGETFADDTAIGMTLMAYGSTQGYWQSRQITDYVLSTDTATVDTWTVTPSGTITYIVLGSPPASTSAPPAVNVVQVSGDATAADTLELFAEALDQSTGQLDSGSLAAGTLTASAIASDAITAAKLAADVTTELQSGLATAAALTTIDNEIATIDSEVGVIDGLVNAIKAKTDQLTFSAAGFVDANVMEFNDNGGLTGDGGATPIEKA